MAMEHNDIFAQLQHLLGPQNNEFKALEKQHNDTRAEIKTCFQGSVKELELNYQRALDEEQKSFLQSKEAIVEDILHKFICTFGKDKVQKCLGNVHLTTSESTPSTSFGSLPITGSTSSKAAKRGPGRPRNATRRSRRNRPVRPASLTRSRDIETHDGQVLTITSAIDSSIETLLPFNKPPSMISAENAGDESGSEGTITENLAAGTRQANHFEAGGGRSLLCDENDSALLSQQLARN